MIRAHKAKIIINKSILTNSPMKITLRLTKVKNNNYFNLSNRKYNIYIVID